MNETFGIHSSIIRWKLSLTRCAISLLFAMAFLRVGIDGQARAQAQNAGAETVTSRLDQDLPRLKSVFSHSFQEDGIADKFFKITQLADGMKVVPTNEGIQLVPRPSSRYIVRDHPAMYWMETLFIEVGFTRLKLETSKADTGILMQVFLDTFRSPIHGISRILTGAQQDVANASVSLTESDGSRTWQVDSSPSGCVTGRFRLARRGEDLYYLLADGDSKVFRLLRMEEVFHQQIRRGRIRLQAICNGTGGCSVV